MKKLLFALFLFLTIQAFGQFTKPTGLHTLPTYSFWKNNADSTVTIYMGSIDLWNTLLSKFDSVKTKGYATNYKLLSYKRINDTTNNRSGYATLWRLTHKLDSILGMAKLRTDSTALSGYFTNFDALSKRDLNNHDSLSTLQERKYQSLTDTLTWGSGFSQTGHTVKADTSYLLKKTTAASMYWPQTTLFKLRADSILNSGFYTNYKASILNNLANNTWTKVYDYAGNLSNLFKLSKDNVIEGAFPLGINSFYFVQNQGINEIVSIPISTASATGTEHGVEITVGANKIMKVSAKVNATGTADSTRVTLSSGSMIGIGKNAKASVDIEAGTSTRVPIQLASGDTTGLTRPGAIGFNNDTYYGVTTTGAAKKHFAFVQNPLFKDTITTPVLKMLYGKGAGKIPVSDANGKMVLTGYTQGILKTSSTGIIAPLAYGDAGKYMQSNGPTSDPSWVTIVTSSGDFLDAVLGMQVDATLNPSLTTGNRYIILDAATLHANFGTIDKNMAGGALALGNGDIVQYTGSEFRIAFDASAATTNVTVLVTLDKNGASSHDWTYNVDTDTWVDRGSTTLHNSLSDLNTGAGTYYHLTQAQHSSQPLIKSDTTTLVATKTNLTLKKDLSDSTDADGYTRRDRFTTELFKKRDSNNHDSLSTLDEKSYNSLTDKPNLGIYRQLNDHDSLSTLQEKNYSSLDGKPDLSVYRLLNNHDSLSTLDEKDYASLTGKPDLSIYRLNNDHDSLSTLQEKNYSSLDGKPDLTVYRLNNDHDSLATLQEKSYDSLTDKPNLAVYRLLNNHDSLSTLQEKSYNSLTDKPTFASFVLPNDEWIPVINYASDTSRLWKLSKDNIITPAYTLGVNSLWFVRNQGVNNIVDIPVDASSTADTEHGVKIVVGGETVLRATAKSDGAGRVDSVKIEAKAIKLTEGAGYRKIPISRNSLGDLKYAASAYLDTSFVNRLLVATASNVIGQLELGTGRKMLMGITDSVPKWKVPTTYDITPTANRFFITPSDTIRLDSLQTYLTLKKDLSDSIDADGYTRRDRLATELVLKQNTLVSATNIKTINGTTLLGSGDLSTIQTTVSGNAGTVTVAANTTNATYYPLFVTSATGSLAPQTTAAKLTFNPYSGTLMATIFQLSDRRYKNHIKPLEDSDYAKIAQIGFRKFYMNDDSVNIRHYGAIAQDVEKVLPEFVDTNIETGKKTVNYTELLLLKVAQLEQVIKDQEKRISKLEKLKKKWRAEQCVIGLP